MQHRREAFEMWTSILNRDSAADHQLISAIYLIISPTSRANEIPKSSNTIDGRILHNHVSHHQGILKQLCIGFMYCAKIQLKQISVKMQILHWDCSWPMLPSQFKG